MSSEPTLPQDGPERRQAQEKSLQRAQPPTQVPGYEPERFLGVGAYGEVWVALEKNTGRRVAIKFYTHRGGLDWSLLSREVEKLAFLFADRYVVQLVGVGWESEPPYYIMEYLEHGSLAERLRSGPLSAGEAVAIFRDIAVGLIHAHGKGVLHCDLKPANILLDQDGKPRLADFGQSRLSHEQVPALGTLFYMAPEQADLEAVPDARWDVYALGALLYCMLTGEPPHRSGQSVEQLERVPDLQQRLARYRRTICGLPTPTAHRQVAGVDRALAEIVERCLAADPNKRYPNVQAVLAALDARDANRARRPMRILGAVGPALVLLVVSFFAWSGFSKALRESNVALRDSALKSNDFAAEFVARTAGNELERRFDAVELVAFSDKLRQLLQQTIDAPEAQAMLGQLSDAEPVRRGEEDKLLGPLRDEFLQHEARKRLQAGFEELIPERMRPGQGNGIEEVASWFFCDKRGVSTVRVPELDPNGKTTIGKNFAWRSYFHGGSEGQGWRDREEWWRPGPRERLKTTELSAAFRSQFHDKWIVAVACPVYEEPPSGGEFLGVVALTVKVGRFVELQGKSEKLGRFQSAVLVDQRAGAHTGMILQHPLLAKLQDKLPADELNQYRLPRDELPDTPQKGLTYRDPLADLAARLGLGWRNKLWLAQAVPVPVRGEETGWWVIVQEPYDTYEGTIVWTLDGLKSELALFGLAALVMVLLVVLGLWGFSIRLLQETSPSRLLASPGDATERSTASLADEAPTEPQSHPGSTDSSV